LKPNNFAFSRASVTGSQAPAHSTGGTAFAPGFPLRRSCRCRPPRQTPLAKIRGMPKIATEAEEAEYFLRRQGSQGSVPRGPSGPGNNSSCGGSFNDHGDYGNHQHSQTHQRK